LQYSIISAGTKCVSNPDSILKFLPNTCFIKEVESTIREAEQTNCNHPIIVVLMHETDFKEINSLQGIIDIPQFNKLINSLKSKQNIELLSISQAIEKIPRLNVVRYQYYRKIRNLTNLLPSFITCNERNSKLLIYRKQLLSVWFKVSLFLFIKISLIPLIITFCLSNLFFNKYPVIIILSILINFIFIVGLLFHIIIKNKIYQKLVYFTFVIIGVWGGGVFHAILK